MSRTSTIHAVLLLSFTCLTASAQTSDMFKSKIWLRANDGPTSQQNSDLLNFNPAIHFNDSSDKLSWKKVVPKESSVFFVFQSKSTNEVAVLSLNRTAEETIFTNRKISAATDYKYDHGNPSEGVLVSFRNFSNSFPVRRLGSLSINESVSSAQGKDKLMELIYLPRFATNLEKRQIETYLSVKYGVSLAPGSHYVNSARDTIWNADDMASFGTRVTGIGRDDATTLLQKQSGNFKKDGLYIGVGTIKKTNRDNKAVFADNTYLLWGDNGKPTALKKINGVKQMPRVWAAVCFSKKPEAELITQFAVNRSEMEIQEKFDAGDTEKFWLAIDTTSAATFDYASAFYTAQTQKQNDSIIFDKISWRAGKNFHFTVVKAAPFFVVADAQVASCADQSTKTSLTMVGGASPYSVAIKGKNFEWSSSVQSSSASIDLPFGSYTVFVKDSKGATYTSDLKAGPFAEATVQLLPNYTLNEQGSVDISPTASPETFTYKWTHNDRTLSEAKTLTAHEPGQYRLEISTDQGCKETLETTVIDGRSETLGKWWVYPNPTVAYEPFHVAVRLPEVAAVTISIFDQNGKLVRNADLGSISHYDWDAALSSAGTYIVKISIAGKIETGKIIIR